MRSEWSIEYQSSGLLWIADGTIYTPNDNFARELISTQTTVILANGSKAYVTPEIKYNYGTISFIWYDDDGTMKDKISSYITNQEKLRITTALSEQIIGKFISLRYTLLLGIDTTYDLEAVFEVQE